ncbi:hypothetical protein NR798_42735 [Archangium gephyra]|uniref:hypothetical protein n=1 Tax=Archangium gephyra TaxID=48 RepID=UPI0035D3FF83
MSVDIRRQLEGGIETLEVAHARYVLLEKALLALEWQQETLRRLDTLRELVRQESGVVEALARLRQRARAEQWPETELALGLARKVERLRSRLEALTRKHLDIPADRESRLVDDLARIEQLLTWTMAAPLSPGERVLCQGGCPQRGPLPWFLVPYILGAMFGVWVWLLFFSRAIILRVVLMVLPESLVRDLLDRGPARFWLTGTRLVWRPAWCAPIHIPLHAIRPGGIERPFSDSVRVTLVDRRYFLLRPLGEEDARRLVALLRLNCPASPPGTWATPIAAAPGGPSQ